MYAFLFVLVLSIPVFYIWGIVSFIRTIFKRDIKIEETNNKVSRAEILKTFLPELAAIARKYPKKTLSSFIQEYQEAPEESEVEEDTPSILFNESPKKTGTKQAFDDRRTVSVNWQNWINDNSINLLLYLGAFLIVAAASIFVGFQWQTFSGYTKAGMLTGLTALFFILGLWFYQMPKIKNAGSTFIGIGSLLLPICGAGWYTFVLKDLGIGIGPVWLLTSIVALIIYIALANFLKTAFYTYVASLSTLSFSFSFVNVYHLANDFYILAAMLSSLVLLITSIVFRKLDKKSQQLFTQPLSLSAHITLPASLLYGFVIAFNSGSLFTVQSSISIFLASGFYILSYIYFKKIPFLAVSQLLLSVGLWLLCQWLNLDVHILVYILMVFALYEVFLGYVFQTRTLIKEAQTITIIGIMKLTIFFIFALFPDIQPIHLLMYAITAVTGGIVAFSIRKHVVYLGYSFLGIAVATYILYGPLLHFDTNFDWLGIIYTFYGVGCYAMLMYFKKTQSYFNLFGIATVTFILLGIILTITTSGYCLVVSLVSYALLLHAGYYFSEERCIYLSNIILSFSLWNLLQALSVSYDYYPLAYSALYTVYYFVSSSLVGTYRRLYRVSALCGLAATPIIFGLSSFEYRVFNSNPSSSMEYYALLTAYIATVIYALDSVKNTSKIMGYTASAFGMLTFLWQIYLLNVSETQVYTIPLSFYFFVLAYFQNKSNHATNRNTLNGIGIFFLLAPSFIQSFGDNGLQYSLLFGFEGILLLMVGITMKYKLFIYSGSFAIVFAVISQTYQYVFAIPRWVLVGSIGLLFLIVAIYLLNKRKE